MGGHWAGVIEPAFDGAKQAKAGKESSAKSDACLDDVRSLTGIYRGRSIVASLSAFFRFSLCLSLALYMGYRIAISTLLYGAFCLNKHSSIIKLRQARDRHIVFRE